MYSFKSKISYHLFLHHLPVEVYHEGIIAAGTSISLALILKGRG